jgi:hypothetical protein
MKTFSLVATALFLFCTQLKADVIDRALLAEKNCQLKNLAAPTYTPASAGMSVHYQPSNLQRATTPIYKVIIDDFGGIIQSLISGSDEYQVAYSLGRLGRIVGSSNGTKAQKICMATCMVNHLMQGDEDVFPTTSMTLAVARGRGFCRHFSLATLRVLAAAKIDAKYEVAIDHMFLKLNLDGKRYYTDPSNQDGLSDCNFIPVK